MTGLATLETDRLRIIQRAEYHRACRWDGCWCSDQGIIHEEPEMAKKKKAKKGKKVASARKSSAKKTKKVSK